MLDQSAQSLVSRRTAFIAALIPSINNSNFADTTRAITEVFEETGIQLLLGYTDYSTENEERLVEAMLRRRPEGMIVTGGMHTARTRRLLEQANIPIIEMWDVPERPIQHVVGFSNAGGRRGARPLPPQARLPQDRLHRRHVEPRRARRRAARRLRAGLEGARPAGRSRHLDRIAADLDAAWRRGDRAADRAGPRCRGRDVHLRPAGVRCHHGMRPPRLEGAGADRDRRLRRFRGGKLLRTDDHHGRGQLLRNRHVRRAS